MAFKYIELFAGIGGFRSALDPLGGECVFASEIDRFATESYRALYNGADELHGDITQIDAEDIPDHDVLVAGFPCQSFSVAGQRKGFEEARGTLFFEIARIASAKQPRLMLLENVKGLLSHDKGQTFETMCAVLNDIGYAIDFRVLNSKHYGVPQNRERIFVVCDRDAEHTEWDVVGSGVEAKAKRRAQALGIRTFNFDWPTEDTVTTRLRDVLESAVDERYYLSEEKIVKISKWKSNQQPLDNIKSPEDISATITARGAGSYHSGMIIIRDHTGQLRVPTELESFRLQGFTDAQHATVKSVGISDSQRYKQAGNAVTVNVISAIGKRMIPLLTETKTEVYA
jgi:DNA-cytosine methyltransferase